MGKVEKGNNIKRREFMDRSAKSAAGLIGYALLKSDNALAEFGKWDKSRVVIVKHENAGNSRRQLDQLVIQEMMDAGIRILTGIQDTGPAWKTLFPGITRSKTISIKVNCINSSLSSHPEVAHAIVNGLTAMEVDGALFPAENIIIWDRTTSELRNAGYKINTTSTGVKCYGTRNDSDYSAARYTVANSSQRLSRILTEKTDYLINLSVLKNHGTTGVTLSMKNHYGTLDNPIHGNYAEVLPALTALPEIRDKQVLCICDAIYGIRSGGPSGYPQFQPNSLIFSRDPVALDTIGTQMLTENGMSAASLRLATFMTVAARAPYNLGTNDPEQIEVVNTDLTTEIEHIRQGQPVNFKLHQNYPNPFNASTTIVYELAHSIQVQLDILDAQGRFVRSVVNAFQSQDFHQHQWDGTDRNNLAVPSGLYFYRLKAGKEIQSRKMVLMK